MPIINLPDLGRPIIEINEEILCTRRDPPPILYHYTNREGLFGILRNQNLWAKDYRFLGDDKEIEWGHDLIRGVLTSKRKDVLGFRGQGESYRVIELFNTIETSLERARRQVPNHFVTCFSEKGDDLKLWQEHVGDRGGYSLGFDARILDSCGSTGVRLLHVKYQESVQVQALDRVIERAIKRARSMSDVDDRHWVNLAPLLADTLMCDLIDCLCSFKRPCFDFEEEWRCVVTPSGIQRVHWEREIKVVARSETRYVELRSRTRRLPLLEIIAGPEAKQFDSQLLPQLSVELKKSQSLVRNEQWIS